MRNFEKNGSMMVKVTTRNFSAKLIENLSKKNCNTEGFKKWGKYYLKRYYFFKKYDEGITLDYESWYSVLPEDQAHFLALRV